MEVAYLGPKETTYTGQATRKIFPDGKLIPIQPIRNIVMAIESGRFKRGVVPIENFYNGEVRETLDSLTECNNTKIMGEKALTIVHCLGMLPDHKEIKRILSKDQALEQCSRYLVANYKDAETISTSSTSEAAQLIARDKMLDAAAIASEDALRKSGLERIATDLCPNNKTRFVVLGREYTASTGDDKTFLAIHPPIDKPGVLDDTLSIFASLGINLEFIQSRPDGQKGYYFYVELDGHINDERVKQALYTIKLSLDPQKKYKDAIKLFGSYPNTHWKN